MGGGGEKRGPAELSVRHSLTTITQSPRRGEGATEAELFRRESGGCGEHSTDNFPIIFNPVNRLIAQLVTHTGGGGGGVIRRGTFCACEYNNYLLICESVFANSLTYYMLLLVILFRQFFVIDNL